MPSAKRNVQCRAYLTLLALSLPVLGLNLSASEKDKAPVAKAPLPPPPPSVRHKTEDALRNHVVDFELAMAEAAGPFGVDEFTRHDYTQCAAIGEKLEKSTHGIYRVHEDRLRIYGNEYHHLLQLLAINAHRLRVAVAERNRTEIFTYWAQLRTMRDKLALSHLWQPDRPAPPESAPLVYESLKVTDEMLVLTGDKNDKKKK